MDEGGEIMDIMKKLPNINKHIDENKPYIKSGENAHLGLSVPEIVFKYGNIRTKAKSLPNVGKYMFGSIKQMKKSYSELYNQPQNPSIRILDNDLYDLKSLAFEMGIGDIGFTEVDESYIFSDKKNFV